MPRHITRRRLLKDGAKTALALGAGVALRAEAAAYSSAGVTAQAAARGKAARLRQAFAALDAFVARHMREAGAPGLTLALADGDGLLRASVYGAADLKTRAPVRPGTLFQIGSISKSFTAIALLQLRDEGMLDLLKPLADYLPGVPFATDYAPVTAHHLLSHTSGLPGGISFIVRGPAERLWTGFAPGEHFVYSNPGYEILGLLLEALDKRPLAEVFRERVFKPLGMASSEPVITGDIRARSAVGYAPLHDDRPFPRGGQLAEAPWVEMGNAAGSIASTPSDMAAYLRMLLNRGRGPGGRRVISDESFGLLTRPVIRAPFRGEEASYAYGLWVSEREGHTHLRHTGGMVAFSSAMHVDLTGGLGAFASVNANLAGYRPVAVTKYALEVVGAALGGKDLPPAPPPAPAPEEVKDAADYAGTYTSPDGRTLTLAGRGDRLLLLVGGQPVALERAAKDSFVVKHPRFALFRLVFGREQGRVVEASHGAEWFTNARYAGPRAFEHPREWEAYPGHYRSESPWFGGVRVVLRKGRLWLDGEQEIFPLGPGTFRVGEEEWSPERAGFDLTVNGRAMRLNVSGVDFNRTFTP